ncbi:MAG TPA: LysM domain-containing protein, partial [Anaerolineales bacterium]|nr:LysM domain-containing protein [Anaerolineales bacterium]
QVSVNGAVVDGKLHWTMIDYYADASSMGGGGGGGGGMGFYPLNLSGTPIPFPTAAPVQDQSDYTDAELASFIHYTVQDGDTLASIASAFNVSMMELSRVNNLNDSNVIAVGWVLIIPGVSGPTQLDGEEGSMRVQIFEKPDGRLREEYMFISTKGQLYYQVKGENLQQLQGVANRPIKIWGTITYDELGSAWITLEKFESLYPDLQFEVLTGTQENTAINGTDVVLFTTGGTTYIQMISSGGYPDYSFYDGVENVHLEVLRIPDETYAGYPTLRVFYSGPAINTLTGQQIELPRLTDKIQIYPDPYGNEEAYVPPDLAIQRVELVYLTNHPAYRDGGNPDAPAGQGYVQPAWHFQGRYSNGDIVDILIQALKQEYLSPDLDP